MDLSAFSTEQLNLFAHTAQGVYRQLDEINTSHLSEEQQNQRERLLAQAYVLGEQLDLEIARRSLADLHAQLGIEESTTLEIAEHALLELKQLAARGKEWAHP